jgi:hypothetical protein
VPLLFKEQHMADRYYGCEFGDDKLKVVEGGSSTAAKDVEIRITYDAANNSKQATIRAIEVIRQRIIEDTWPPV